MGFKKGTTKRQRRLIERARKKAWRAKNIIHACWLLLRSNAKKRNISCGITLLEFTDWCIETGYHLLKGRSASCATIDRIDNSIGYEKGNLQILCCRNNVLKEWARRRGIPWVDGPDNFNTQQWKPADTDTQF